MYEYLRIFLNIFLFYTFTIFSRTEINSTLLKFEGQQRQWKLSEKFYAISKFYWNAMIVRAKLS